MKALSASLPCLGSIRFIQHVIAVTALFILALYPVTSPANQITEFSVFQPVNGISTNVFIERNQVVVQTSGQPGIRLKQINPALLYRYADRLYKIDDANHDGVIDVAVLDGVNTAQKRFCYKVYSYVQRSRQFDNTPSYTECTSNAGTVLYAANKLNVAKQH